MSTASIEKILDDFEIIDDWEDRYRYIIDLGKALPAMPESLKTDATKVRGCASQVWMHMTLEPSSGTWSIQCDSDAMIVRGLIAVLLAVYSGKSSGEVLSTDAAAILQRLGLDKNLSQQRSNGLSAMVERIRSTAAQTQRL